MHVAYPAVVAALLFSIGIYGVLARRNAILVLMSVELMLNAVNLNLVAFDVWLRDALRSGQVFALFVITLAAAETGLGLAIILMVFRNRRTADVDALRAQGELEFDAALSATPGLAAGEEPAAGHRTSEPGEAGAPGDARQTSRAGKTSEVRA
jgi:NADH-quinone oxidoreductase subunit K